MIEAVTRSAAVQDLALPSTSYTAAGAVTAALIAAGIALWQMRRNRMLEREKSKLQQTVEERKIELQEAADRRKKEHEWEQEERRRAQEREREEARAREREAARRGSMAERAVDYCTRLVGELSTLHILDMSRPLPLDRLYVQVRVQEHQPLRFVRDEEPVQERRRDEGARKESVAPESAAAHTYAPVDALQRYHRVVVVGDPGAGKTTMLRHLALRMARRDGGTLPEIPAYVELVRFIESGHDSLLDYLARHWEDRYGFADAQEYLVEKLTDGTAALLLDGLDEVQGGQSVDEAAGAYNRVTKEIARLATRFPKALIATTCRRHGWQGGLPQFQVLEALDFEWPQIETFIANWFGEGDRHRSGLLRALSANARLQTLAANPLLLSLIAIVYESDLELPERRATLYKRCVEVLLREWDAHRQIARYSRFTRDRKQDLLKQIACHYHQRGLRTFPEADLLELIADFLPTIDLPRTDNRKILDEIAAQYGLLKAQAHGVYGFLHLTLQEYFAASALLEQGAAGVERAVAARYDPWWEEVILLMAGSPGDASELLLGVLQLRPGRPRTRKDAPELLHLPDDDLFHTDLLLAARCLTGSPRVTDVELRAQIVRTVWELLKTSPYAGERQRAAEAVVGVIGSDQQLGEVIAYITDEAGTVEARAALVDALAARGGRDVGKRLLGVLTLGSELPEVLHEHLVMALGTLGVGEALSQLSAELDELLNRADSPAREVGVVLRALGAMEASTDVILRTIDVTAGWSDFRLIADAVRDVLADVRDPGVREPLLELLVRNDEWFFERSVLAEAYLDIAGEGGAGTLLDVVRSGRTTDSQKLPLMMALTRFITAKGHSRTHRDALLAVAHDDAMIWQVRWLALECLDDDPGSVEEIQALFGGPDVHVSVAAAATSAVWGTSPRLDIIRDAVLKRRVSTHMMFEVATNSSMVWPGRIAKRLADALAPYGDIGLRRHFSDLVRAAGASSADGLPVPMDKDVLAWTLAFGREAGIDAYLSPHLISHGLFDTDVMIEVMPHIPNSRVQAVLRHCLRDRNVRVVDPDVLRLLDWAAAAANDPEAVAMLLRFLPRGRKEGPVQGVGARDKAHDLAYAVSRRARVRVLPDHTIVPLP
ncbi:NACHT domain-containing protein [Streptomyces sp. CA-251387]|uniref:NACHT domain-containing protein n=1 Tax=Streptomyces sp. CA-251387 TaxID=3240064 RepID=UPI003D8FEC3A